jgi:hypothetical protein
VPVAERVVVVCMRYVCWLVTEMVGLLVGVCAVLQLRAMCVYAWWCVQLRVCGTHGVGLMMSCFPII